jgi:predicted FMN-binding regulatory protein PaiB
VSIRSLRCRSERSSGIAYEGKDGWNLDALPPGNAEAQTRGIVAFRMLLTKAQAKIKLSQNRELDGRVDEEGVA